MSGTGAGRGAAVPKPQNPVLRTVQRYLIPAPLASMIIALRDHAYASWRSEVQVSNLVRFGAGTVIKPFAVVQSGGGQLQFGKNCAIGSFCYVAAGFADVIAGDHVRLGTHVSIIGSSREYRSRDKLIVDQGFRCKGIRIGNDVLIGSHAVLVDGCEIGDGAVIGAGSVVSGKIPEYSIVFGSPAKVIFWRR